jgi:hypothetical protein
MHPTLGALGEAEDLGVTFPTVPVMFEVDGFVFRWKWHPLFWKLRKRIVGRICHT